MSDDGDAIQIDEIVATVRYRGGPTAVAVAPMQP
jgi:hypothetical protein